MPNSTIKRDYMLPNGVYDLLTRLVQIGLPALATFYFTLAQIYGWTNGPVVVATITAATTFLGVLLSLSNNSYNHSESKFDGSIVIEQQPSGAELFSLELVGDPRDLKEKTAVSFKIAPHPSEVMPVPINDEDLLS